MKVTVSNTEETLKTPKDQTQPQINTINSDTEQDEWYDAVESLDQDKLKDDPKTSKQTIIYSKIAELGEQIEGIEKTVITSEQDNTKGKEITIDKESDISKEIEEILQDWTVKIQDRYKSVGELEAEEVQSLILEVIKTHNSKVSLTQVVNDELQAKIKVIESLEYRKVILSKALNNFDKNTGLSNTKVEVGTTEIVEIKKIIEAILPSLDSNEDKNELKSLTDTDKSKLLNKTIEFLTLQSLVYNEKEKTSDNSNQKSIEDVSKELKEYCSKRTNKESRVELEEQYTQLCTEKIKTILKELQILEDKFGTSSGLNPIIIAIIEGLENFSSNNYNRHEFYDKILEQLELCLEKKITVDQSEDITATRYELENLKQRILLEQWENFVQEQKNRNVSDKEEEIILGILKAYCVSEDDSLNIEELEYHIDNMIESNKLSSQSIYTTINNLSNEANSKVVDNKRDKINFLKAFILSKADQIELKEITKLFEDRLNYQEEQYKEVLEIKNIITKEFAKYCGILDKSNKENYTKVIKLYLDKLDRLVAEGNAEDISYSKRKEVFYTLKQSITDIIANSSLKDGDKAEYIENEISKTLSTLAFATSHIASASILSTDILEHLNKNIDSSLETQSDYKRKTKTVQTIKLEDLFDNNGRINEKEGKEVFFRNKTVIVNIDQEEYYRLSEDINSLRGNQSTYKKSIEEYRKELSVQYKRYKLVQLKNAINIYYSNKNIKNLSILLRVSYITYHYKKNI